jgi:hypothetical protein
MSIHERTYRLGMRAYPRDYRSTRGEEIVTTLMDAHGEQPQSMPRELAAIVVDGLRRRLAMRPITGVAAWRSGALVAAYILATTTVVLALLGLIQENRLDGSLRLGATGMGPRFVVAGVAVTPWFALFAAVSAGTLVTLALGVRRVAAVLAATGLVLQLVEVLTSRSGPYAGWGGHYAVYRWTNASAIPGRASEWLVPAVLLPVLIWVSRCSRRRSVPALLVSAVTLLASYEIALGLSHGWGGFVMALPALGLFVLLAIAVSPFDPRPAIASIPLLLSAIPLTWTYAVTYSSAPAEHGVLLLVALPLMACGLAVLAGWSSRRQPTTR